MTTPSTQNPTVAKTRYLWTGALALAAAFSGWGKYWYEQGKVAGETETTKVLQEKINDQASRIAELTASVAVQTDRAQRASEDFKKSADEVSKLTAKIADAEKNIAVYDARAKGADNCAFVRQRIENLQVEINKATKAGRQSLFVGNEESNAEAAERQKRNDAETAPMRQQLLAFTERLKECTQPLR